MHHHAFPETYYILHGAVENIDSTDHDNAYPFWEWLGTPAQTGDQYADPAEAYAAYDGMDTDARYEEMTAEDPSLIRCGYRVQLIKEGHYPSTGRLAYRDIAESVTSYRQGPDGEIHAHHYEPARQVTVAHGIRDLVNTIINESNGDLSSAVDDIERLEQAARGTTCEAAIGILANAIRTRRDTAARHA